MLETTLLHPTDRDERAEAATPRVARPSVDTRSLLAGARELLIRHGAEEYRLRLTRNDKLILTK